MTVSPTLTSSDTRVPSSNRPGPTATTSPSCGFSLAVSGMTMPEAVVSSPSPGLTTMRSSSGCRLTLIVPPVPGLTRPASGHERVALANRRMALWRDQREQALGTAIDELSASERASLEGALPALHKILEVLERAT